MDKERVPPVRPMTEPERSVQDSRTELVQQVLASRTFAKSARLSQFLEFICRKAIEGQSDQINEQQIGVHVFGRSLAYNATDDSIVRTQARLLRQRLEEYFEHECPACAMVVLIPKGGYVPVFEQRRATRGLGALVESPAAEEEPRPAQAAMAPQEQAARSAGTAARRLTLRVRGRRLMWLVVAMACVVAALAVWHRDTRSLLLKDTLWGNMFGSGRAVVIVPSDDGLVLSEELRRAPVTLDEYLSGTYLREESPAGADAGRVTAAWLASHQYTSTADLGVVLRLNRLPEATSALVETKYARVLRLDELKSRNVILIGGIGANPWVGLFSPRLNFDVNYDWKSEQGYVINKNPQPGEQPIYREQKGAGGASSYGVLAYLPGVSGNGRALLFEGSGMAGTEAASDFPFSGDAFSAFLAKLGQGAGGTIPYFEVLLETRSLGGDAPQPQIVAWRVVRR